MYDPEDLQLRENVPEEEATPALHEDLAEYYALITSLDDQLERLLDTLEAYDMADDTLVVFTSDHGEMLGSQGRYRKGFPFEESVHVPLVMCYPGEIDARTIHEPVTTLDLFPTLLSYGGQSVPETAEGSDLRGVLSGSDTDIHPEGVYLQNNIPFDDGWRALRTDQHLVVVDRDLDVRFLYDTDADPYQRENLAGDPSHADLEAELFDTFIRATERHADSLLWSRWYTSEVLDNPLGGENAVFGEYEDLPGDRPRFDPGS